MRRSLWHNIENCSSTVTLGYIYIFITTAFQDLETNIHSTTTLWIHIWMSSQQFKQKETVSQD